MMIYVEFEHGITLAYHKDLELFDSFEHWISLLHWAGVSLTDIVEAEESEIGTWENYKPSRYRGTWTIYFKRYDKNNQLDFNWIELRKDGMTLAAMRQATGDGWSEPFWVRP